MQSDEQRKRVEMLRVLPPRGGDESHLAPPGMSSNTRPRSFPSSPLQSFYGTPQVPSQQDLNWPQTLEDQSEWAFAPEALIEQSNQVVDQPPSDLLSPSNSANTYPYSNGYSNSTIQSSTFFHGYPSPISPFSPLYDSQDRSLHYPNGLSAPAHHLASTQRFDRPANQYYNQYHPIMGQNQSGSPLEQNWSGYEELVKEMNASPSVEQQGLQDDSDQASQPDDTPYAQLIYQALMSVDDHQMILRDIYKWIAENTDKAIDPEFTGWQNSVRHNLSMNAAFNKIPHANPADKSKRGFIWALDASAITNGIQPTTRYRAKKDDPKPSSGYKPNKGRVQDILRQRSGRRGGQAAGRRAAREVLQRHDRDRDHHRHRHHKHHQRNTSSASTTSSVAASPYGSSPPAYPTASNTTYPAPFHAPAPLSSFEDSEREDVGQFDNTSGLPELWIRSGGFGCRGFGAGSGMSTPVTSGSECFRTSDEEEDDEKGGGYFGGGVVGASSSGGVLVPTSAAHTAAITTPFMMGLGPLPAAGVAGAGADGGEGEMGGYLADEEGGGVQLNGLPAAGESGGWEFVEEGLGYEDHEHGGMGFEQAFDMDGDDEGEFLG